MALCALLLPCLPGCSSVQHYHDIHPRAFHVVELVVAVAVAIGAVMAACSGFRSMRRLLTSAATSQKELEIANEALQREINERKEIEDALRENETRFRTLTNTISDAIVTVDRTMTIVYANSAAETIFGHPRDELLGQSLGVVMAEDVRETYKQMYLKYVETRERTVSWNALPMKGVHRTGRIIPLEVSMGEFTLDGELYVTGAIRDVTERVQTEKALRESERRFRDIAENASDWIWETDTGGYYTYCSENVRDILGYEAEELVGRWVYDLMPADEAPRVRAAAVAAMEAQRPIHDLENWNVRKDGATVCLLTNGIPVFDDEGELIGYRGIDKDITERKRAESALRESEERMQLALQGGDLGLWDWNLLTGEVYFNERWAQMLGYGRDELDPHVSTWERLLHPNDENHVMRVLEEHLEGRTAHYETEHRLLGKDGGWVWVLDRGEVVERDETGKPVRMAGTHMDITGRKETEAALRASERRFRDLAVNVPGVVYQWYENANGAHGFRYVSPRCKEVLGISAEDLLKDWTILKIHPDDVERWEESLGEALRDNTEWAFEGRFILPSGKIMWWRGLSRPSITEEGTLFNGIIIDLTVHKAAEEALRRAEKQEEELRSRIQDSLLQGQLPRQIKGARVAALSSPSQYMDGDFYDFYEFGEHQLDLVLGDVMGKGMTAALVGAATKNYILRVLEELLAEQKDQAALPSPAAIMQRVHDELTPRLIDLERFVTMVYARFDMKKGQHTFVNAGHMATLHYHSATGKCTRLEGNNTPLGVFDEEHYGQAQVSFEAGDLFFFYSDGFTEAHNAQGHFFGAERLVRYIERHAALPPAALADGLLKRVMAFAAGHVQSDDLTCIAVRLDHAPAGSDATSLDMKSDPRHLLALREYVETQCRRAGLPEEEAQQVVLALNEAAANIMEHAYEGQEDRDIPVTTTAEPGRIVFQLTHNGIPFSRELVPPPDFEANSEGGFGLYIIDQCMDEVRYESSQDGYHHLRLVKLF